MRKSYSYAKEKLEQGIHTLAVEPGDVRSRLHAAFLAFCTLRPDDFPNELRNEWQQIIKRLTQCEPRYNYKGKVEVGSVQQTLSVMQNRTGSKIAKRILLLRDNLDRFI